MEKSKYKLIKNTQKNMYPLNTIPSDLNKKHIKKNSYLKNTKQEKKFNMKSYSIINSKNSLPSDKIVQRNDNLVKQNKSLKTNNSYSIKKMNYLGRNPLNKKSLFQNYCFKEKENYYLNNLQKKRNTLNYHCNKINLKSKINPNVQILNVNEINNLNNFENNHNRKKLKKELANKSNNILYESNLLKKIFNTSKSSNDMFKDDAEQDIIIEYNNVPMIDIQRHSNNYLNSYIYRNNNYKYKNLRLKRLDNSSCESNNDDHVIANNKNLKNSYHSDINFTSFLSNDLNKSRGIFDRNLNTLIINNNYSYMPDESSYNLMKKDWLKSGKSSNNFDISNINKNENTIYNNVLQSSGKYHINNSSILTMKNNNINYSNSLNRKINNINIFNNNLNLSNLENGNNRNKISKKFINRIKLINIANKDLSNINDLELNNIYNKKNDSMMIKQRLKKNNNKLREELFNKGEYQTIKQKSIKSNSPSHNPKDIMNFNKYNIDLNINANKKKIIKNNKSNLNDSIMNKYKLKNEKNLEIYNTSNLNTNKSKNRNFNQNNSEHKEKIVLFKKDIKNNNNINASNSIDIYKNKVSSKLYNIYLNNNYIKNIADKKINLSVNNPQKSISHFETNTSRYKNSKIKNQKNINTESNLNKNLNMFNKNILNISNKKKKLSNSSPNSNNILSFYLKNKNNINDNNLNDKCKIISININEHEHKYNINNPSTIFLSKKEEKENKESKENICKTDNNINNGDMFYNYINNNYNNINNYNDDYYSVLKTKNDNKQLNNSQLKLCLKKYFLKSNDNVFKDNDNDNDKNLYNINNNLKQSDISNNNALKKNNSTTYHNKSNDVNNIFKNKKNNSKIININNNTSNINVLNVGDSRINICIDKKEKLNFLYPEKNLFASSVGQIENKNNNFIKDDLLKLPINMNRNSNINTNINNNEIENKRKSYKNIIIRRNNNNKMDNIIKYKKQILFNNSEFFSNIKKLDTEYSNNDIENKKKLNLFNIKNNSIANINKINLTNNNINENNNLKSNIKYNIRKYNLLNKGKQTKSRNLEKNNINLLNYKNIEKNLIATNNSIQTNNNKCDNGNDINENKCLSPSDVYIKPFCILSDSKSTQNINKSKSEMKINDKKSYKDNFIPPKNREKNSKSLSPQICYITSLAFYQKKDENIEKNINSSIKKGITLNPNIINNNKPINENKLKIRDINNNFKKQHYFYFKIYKYFIKQPKIEKCYFTKNISNKKNKNNNYSSKNDDLPTVQIIYNCNSKDEENNNENSNNGLVITFGDIYNDKINNIGNINDNFLQDSNYDINKTLKSELSQNKNDSIYNDYSIPNINFDYNNITNKKNKNKNNKDDKIFSNSFKYNIKNIEKGLKILGKISLRKRVEKTNESLNNEKINKNSIKIYLGANKLNELFNDKRDISLKNIGTKYEDINIKNIQIQNNKYDKNNVKKEIIKNENIKEKNNLNKVDINSDKNNIKNYDDKNIINIYSTKTINDIDNNNLYYSEIVSPKIKAYKTKFKKRLDSSKENKKSKSYLYNINDNDNICKYKENEILLDSKELEKNISQKEDFENYLIKIKKNQSNNVIKHEIIYLLNILTEKNYPETLERIIKLILYKNDNSISSNNNIKENEHFLIYNILERINNEINFIFLYVVLCNDVNKNISKLLNEQNNNKEENLKPIINDECMTVLNNFKNSKKFNIYDKEQEEYNILKRKIFGYTTFVYELINLELLNQQFGIYVLEEFYQIYNDNKSNNIIGNVYLEVLINFLNKYTKLIYQKNNIILIEKINNFINNNIENIINNQKINIPKYLTNKMKNLIIPNDNKKQEVLSISTSDILEKEKVDYNNNSPLKNEIKNSNDLKCNYDEKIKNKELNGNDINKSIIEEDLINYISYYTEDNNKDNFNNQNINDKSYNWKIIEELINDKNVGLELIINYYISACINIINDDNQIILSNDYIKNIIEYYSNNLSKTTINSIHNEMKKIYLNIDDIVNKNKNMFKIMGYLLFILIENKLYHIKYFNNYLKVEKHTKINLAIITKYCIITSGKYAKKYLNDFKQTKLFLNNEIFIKYVNDELKDLLYFIQ